MTVELGFQRKSSRRPTYEIRFPQQHGGCAQDEECCEVLVDSQWRRLRLHDYDQIYRLPGLYEQLFDQNLQCSSPRRVVSVIGEVMHEWAVEPAELHVLELGAGNGMVGEQLRSLGVGSLVGVDILAEAAAAAKRDRSYVYDDYLVTDRCTARRSQIEQIKSYRPNCLVTVAALGFGDIPPDAFITAYDLVSTPGWIAFNIKESFLSGADTTGFARLIRRMADEEYIQIQSYRRYSHRLSISGEHLHYVAIVARKLRAGTGALLEAAA
jgi:predicted TPR repeat methyltransferase